MLEAFSEIELTIDQFRALALLRQGPKRITDIASTLGIRLSAASTFVDRLEAKRLVERFHDEDDRRVVRCRLTALGAKEAHSLWRINGQRAEHLGTILSRDELERVLEILTLLAAAVDRESSRPAARIDNLTQPTPVPGSNSIPADTPDQAVLDDDTDGINAGNP